MKKLAKIDIKYFYQQGDQNKIAASAFNDHQKTDAEVMTNIQSHALYHQYVYSDLLPRRLFRVRTGSGMGQCCSGELSDWFFYLEVEEWCTNVNVKHDHQIHKYCRYWDDILIV